MPVAAPRKLFYGPSLKPIKIGQITGMLIVPVLGWSKRGVHTGRTRVVARTLAPTMRLSRSCRRPSLVAFAPMAMGGRSGAGFAKNRQSALGSRMEQRTPVRRRPPRTGPSHDPPQPALKPQGRSRNADVTVGQRAPTATQIHFSPRAVSGCFSSRRPSVAAS